MVGAGGAGGPGEGDVPPHSPWWHRVMGPPAPREEKESATGDTWNFGSDAPHVRRKACP